MGLLLACLLCTLLAQATINTAAAETVKVSTIPIFPQIPRGQKSSDFQVLVRVEASPAAEKRRVPIDLVAVLDVGVGMRLVKEAMEFVIRQLHDDDRLAIVGPYTSQLGKEKSSTKLTAISGDGRSNAQKKVDKLEARGDAESTSGLEEAVKILEERPASSSSRASFIILVTDGEDSTRFQNLPGEFRAALRKHPVHTFGFGASHDPQALLSIAEKSIGTYSFVDDKNQITGALAVCLGGLKTVVAVGARVSLEAAERSGVKIGVIEFGGFNNNESPNSAGQTAADVAIGVLYAGEVKSFIVHLHVPAAPPSLEGGCEQKLLTARFHHYGSDSNAPPIQAVLSVQRPQPQAAAVLQKVPILMVVNHIVQFSVLEMVTNFVEDEILPLFPKPITGENGNALGLKLQLLWDKFVLAHQFWSGLDLGGLESEINAMVSTLQQHQQQAGGSRSFSAVSSIFSWMSSYQMQRPTAMGSPHNVVAKFITLDMQVTLQQVTTKYINCGCPVCEQCKDECVEPLPPPTFQPSGRGDDTYLLDAAHQGIWIDAINQAMKQMYLAVVEASNLKRCHSSGAGIEPPQTQQQQQPRRYRWDPRGIA